MRTELDVIFDAIILRVLLVAVSQINRIFDVSITSLTIIIMIMTLSSSKMNESIPQNHYREIWNWKVIDVPRWTSFWHSVQVSIWQMICQLRDDVMRITNPNKYVDNDLTISSIGRRDRVIERIVPQSIQFCPMTRDIQNKRDYQSSEIDDRSLNHSS